MNKLAIFVFAVLLLVQFALAQPKPGEKYEKSTITIFIRTLNSEQGGAGAGAGGGAGAGKEFQPTDNQRLTVSFERKLQVQESAVGSRWVETRAWAVNLIKFDLEP